jgi:hypothetical protein
MIAKQGGNMNMDDLLKNVFTDDLPADVETGMRARIVRFRAGATQNEEPTVSWVRRIPRSAWAILSALMLIAGILLQGLGSRSSLAESIAHIKAGISSSESHRQPEGSGLTTHFHWQAPEGRPASYSMDKEATS